MQPTIEKITQLFRLNTDIIENVFPYGSRIYGTQSPNSDYDFIVLCKDGSVTDEFSLEKENINIHLYNFSTFQSLLDRHKISAIECYSLPRNKVLLNNKKLNFKLDKNKLRSSISEKASHSWVKAKKKFEVEKDRDVYIAKKSLFHSLRIIDFGIQISGFSKILDFASCNDIWYDINTNPAEDWQTYSDLYKETYNEWMSEFRKLAPKEKEK